MILSSLQCEVPIGCVCVGVIPMLIRWLIKCLVIKKIYTVQFSSQKYKRGGKSFFTGQKSWEMAAHFYFAPQHRIWSSNQQAPMTYKLPVCSIPVHRWGSWGLEGASPVGRPLRVRQSQPHTLPKPRPCSSFILSLGLDREMLGQPRDSDWGITKLPMPILVPIPNLPFRNQW